MMEIALGLINVIRNLIETAVIKRAELLHKVIN